MSVVEIPLRARDGEVRAVTLVDEADLGIVQGYRWHLSNTGYARSRARDGTGKPLMMHRLILGLHDNDSRSVDHINHDPLDNRHANLRAVTHAQNMQNVRNRGSRGVYWIPRLSRWEAKVRLAGKNVWLGTFPDFDEAVRVASEWRALHMPFSEDARAAVEAAGQPSGFAIPAGARGETA